MAVRRRLLVMLRLIRRGAAGLAVFGLLIAPGVALFWQAILLKEIFYFGDISRLYYPQRVAFERAIHRGQLPLWTDGAFAGYPLLADGQFGPLYPLNYLLLWLPSDAALNYFILLHLGIAGLSAYALARTLHISRWASVLTGLVYMLGGFCAAHLDHLNILAVAAWLPGLLASSHLALERLRHGLVHALGALAWTALWLTLCLLAGHPQMSLLGLAMLLANAAWVIATGRGDQARTENEKQPQTGLAYAGSVLGALAAVVLVATGLAAAQILPTLELTFRSERAEGLDPDFFASFSMHPAYLVLLASPFLLGDPYPRLSVEMVGYVGILPLLLATLAIFGCRERRIRFYSLLAAGALLLAFGQWNPAYPLLQRVPLLNWFRAPARFLALFDLAMAVLAGAGAQEVSQRLRVSVMGARRAIVLGMALMLASALVGLITTSMDLTQLLLAWRVFPLILALAMGGLLFAALRGRLRRDAFAAACLVSVVLDLGAFGAVFGQTFNATMPREAFSTTPRSLALLRADSIPYRVYTHEEIVPVLSVMRESLYPNIALLYDVPSANGFFPLIPKSWARFAEDLTSQKLNLLHVKYFLIPQILPVDEQSEFYDVEDPFSPTLVGRQVQIPTDDLPALNGLIVESYASHATDLPDGYLAAEIILTDSTGQEVRLPLRTGLETAEWAYERSDVRANIRHQKAPVARSWPARSGFPPEDHLGHVYRAEYRIPEGFAVRNIYVKPNLPCAFVRIERFFLLDTQGGWHLLSHLIGEGNHTLVYRSEDVAIYENHDMLPRAFIIHQAHIVGDDRLALEWLGDKGFDPTREVIIVLDKRAVIHPPSEADEVLSLEADRSRDVVEFLVEESQRLVLQATASSPGYLVLCDAYYPGWQARVDGELVPILKANGYFRAIYLRSGRHEVEFVYRPRSFQVGAVISFMMCCCLGAIPATLGHRGKNRPCSNRQELSQVART